MENETGSKTKFYKRWWFWVVVIVVLAAIGLSSGKQPTTSVPAAADNATTTQQATSAAPQTLLSIAGSGTKTTQTFIAAGNWDLTWSYDCSKFGYQGNFIVTVYNSDGSLSFQNTAVNQTGMSGSDVEHYHSGGSFYLVVNSECSWKATVTG